jgi:acetolactate synthase-1/2/3 large subunit
MSPETNEPLYWNPKKPWGHELVVNTLLEQGVEYIFTLTGGHIAPLLTAAEQKGIKVVSCHTEEAAVLAAIGYAVQSNKVGVACLTAGMTGYAHPAILNANWGQVPVVILNGAAESYAEGTRTLQEYDTKAVARSAEVKEAFRCTVWERIPQMTTWAFKAATGLIPGVGYIEYPIDLLCSTGDPEKIKKWTTTVSKSRAQGDPELIKQAVQILLTGEHPAINVGRLANYAGAGPEIREFVKLTGIPVDGCNGTVGTNPLNNLGPTNGMVDVGLVLGKLQTGIEGGLLFNPFPGAKLVSVYPEPTDIGRVYPVELGIVGDVKLVMRQMIEEAKKYKFPDYTDWVDLLKGSGEGTRYMFDTIADEAVTRMPMHPATAAKTVVDWVIENKINKEAIFAPDGANNMYWYFMFATYHGITNEYPHQTVMTGGNAHSLGNIGASLACAVGAACAHPDKFLMIPSVGDGTFYYHAVELETLARLNVPAVVVVHNNNAFSMVYDDQRRVWGKKARAGSFFQEKLHYEWVGEGLGCAKGEFVEKPDDIVPALDRAYARAKKEKKPVVVTVMTDANVYLMEYGWWMLPPGPDGDPYTGMGME